MNWEDDNERPPVAPKDTKTLDLFALAQEPPKPEHLLKRCENGCAYVKDPKNPLSKPKCSKCDHSFVR